MVESPLGSVYSFGLRIWILALGDDWGFGIFLYSFGRAW